MGKFSEILNAAKQHDAYWEARLRQQFAADLLGALADLGISQREFAEKAAVSPGYVSRVLAGNENLSLRTLVKLARTLGLELDLSVHKSTAIFRQSRARVQDWSALEKAAYRRHGAPQFQFAASTASAVNEQPYWAQPSSMQETMLKVA
jgi:transcriptional regulator with XRE-family HTH domain